MNCIHIHYFTNGVSLINCVDSGFSVGKKKHHSCEFLMRESSSDTSQ